MARADEWRKVTLGEVADVSWGDTSTTKSSYTDTGFPAYSASGQDGYLPYSDFRRSGVVLSAIGANCGKTWLAKGQWSCIKNTIRFWSTDAAVDTEFLYWKTRNSQIWPKRGSAQPFISQGDARALELELPPLPEQCAIAHILGTLDDKIELNRRMNQTLEEMARALFKFWFVNFDPVRAKMTGRWCRSQSFPGLPADLYDLFPDRLAPSELGEIPEGWEVRQFSDIATQLRDNENPAVSPDTEFSHFSIPAYDEGKTPKLELGEDIKSTKSRVPQDTVLLSKLNPEIKRVWLVDVAPDERGICSTEFLVLKARPPFQSCYVYCFCALSILSSADWVHRHGYIRKPPASTPKCHTLFGRGGSSCTSY